MNDRESDRAGVHRVTMANAAFIRDHGWFDWPDYVQHLDKPGHQVIVGQAMWSVSDLDLELAKISTEGVSAGAQAFPGLMPDELRLYWEARGVVRPNQALPRPTIEDVDIALALPPPALNTDQAGKSPD